MNHQNKQPGFTLIELMIVVLVIGILAAIAVPIYQQHVISSERAAAQSAMLEIAGQLERHYTQNNQYPDDSNLSPRIENMVDQAESSGRHEFDIDTENDEFDITVTSVDNRDDDCATMTVNHRGQRTAETDGGADNTDFCW